MKLRLSNYRLRNPTVFITVSRFILLICLGLLSTSADAHPGAGIAVDRSGQIYFLDTGSGLWKIDTRGKLAHLSKTLFHWLALDENNLFANTQLPTGALGEIVRVGTNPTVLLSSDYPIAIGSDGNLYYPSGGAGHLQMMRMTPSGTTSVLVTLPPMVNGKPLPHIGGIIAGNAGVLYYTEDTAIRSIDEKGQVSTVVAVLPPSKAPSIPGMDHRPNLRELVMDERAVIFVADTGDARLLKVTPDGKVSTLVQTQSPWSPTAVAVFGTDLYVLEYLHTTRDVRRDWLPRVRKIASKGRSKLIATLAQMPGAR
jgi:hypothetical protein